MSTDSDTVHCVFMSTGIVSPMLVVETQAVEVARVMGGHLYVPLSLWPK